LLDFPVSQRCIIICPDIHLRRLNAELGEGSTDLGAVVDAVINELDDRDQERRPVGAFVQELDHLELFRGDLLGEGNHGLAGAAGTLAQFGEGVRSLPQRPAYA